jgi:two-component system heavy metal sensor histidine kinase CusS
MIKMSIAHRIVCMIILVSGTVFSASSVWLYYHLQDSLLDQIHTDLTFRHSILDPMLVSSSNQDEWQNVRDKLANLSSRDGGTNYWVLSNNQDYTYGSGPVKPQWLNKPEGFTVIQSPETHRSWVIFTRTIAANLERPELRFVMASDCTPFFNTLEKFRNMLTAASLIGILVIALLAYAIARIGLAPVRKLSAQANSLPPGNSTQRLDTSALPCELKELAASFNGALARQEAAWTQLEGFNANVAHELRTPLTNMLGHTQVILSQKRDVAELENLLESNLEEIERMTGIVNDMLFLSYAESGQRAADLSHVSLGEEALKTVDYLEPVLAENNVLVDVVGDVNATVDRRLFHRALANLLSNSARHVSSGDKVTVTLARKEHYVHVSVSNPGQPIDLDIAARLYERFYRADKARTRSDAHHGLGLSIVRAVATMHGGDVFVNSQHGVNTFGFTMQITPSHTASSVISVID